MDLVVALVLAGAGVGLIVAGAEVFARHLARASARLGVSAFALAILLAGAEPEELATAVTASLRHVPGIAFGDVIGANVAICLLALGVGGWISPLPFSRSVLRYGVLALPLGAIAAAFSWDGRVTRGEGAVLVAGYAAYVASIWRAERRPPMLGETAEVAEAAEESSGPDAERATRRRFGRELALAVVGVAAMAVGALLLVDAVRALSGIEETQTRLGLTVVGFATALELVALAASGARHGVTEAAVAGVVGSYAYNVTMTLGTAALARPLAIDQPQLLRGPWLIMLGSLVVALGLAAPGRSLGRRGAVVLLMGYPLALLAFAI